MNPTRSALARHAAVAIVAAFGAALPHAAIAQTNPLVGTWNFVPEKSTVSAGPARFKSATLTVAENGQMSFDGVDPSGKPVKATYAAIIDGKPHPITGMSTFDTGSWTRNSDTNTSYQYLKGRAIIALGTRVVSPDGKTLTFREQVYDRTGKVVGTAVMIFDNPNIQVASATPGPGGVVMRSPLTPDEAAAAEVLAKGDDDQAIAMFTKIIEAPKPTPMLYYDHVSRGIAYVKKGQNELALADFDAAVKLKPDDVDARFRRGNARAQLKDFKGTIEDMTFVVDADPMNGPAYKLRAFCHNVLGDDKSAGADYDKACSINKELCI